MKESLVIIPTYNERENIEAIVRKVMSLAHPFHLLIIDDNSPDGTATIVRDLQPEYPERLYLETRMGKLGLGTAYIHGFKYALRNGYEYIFEMDADFSHNPDDLIKLHDACAVDGYDVAIGSRYIQGVNVVNWPMNRVLMSWFASWYVRLITGMPIADTTAGFKCYRRKVLKTIQLNKIRFVGYAFQIEMKFLSYKYGFKIKEVPIIFTDRTKGQSKMSSGIFKEAVLGVLKMKVNSFFRHFDRY
ncbi:polyprenol monophosphomannose synthase [Pontibacter sp. BT310]|uniref:Polyprenol monophosphomannose synthase n=1 Tax=Pontibacter populi TaxID=890055 RepID=A0ABS6XCT7_9BACT|nr:MULTISPECIES: polyprenol monophosphomannose synthase [Pontibacter]MBJ6118863.1 polyprenol monophosphomannose synthase [Pontibacter sp. BT310]MBR0571291.1 polyprenol monophosphomannose synthase [Microvirga sp. STS03]MBW3365717.1 polyprenol monophosphomannose synthase [Pontibacter populi]